MPYLTPDYFSAYYFLRGDFNAIFPGLHGNDYLVAKYNKTDYVPNKGKPFLQNQPGFQVVDSGYRLFEYEITGPFIIWDKEPSNFASLLSLGCYLSNYQYLSMTNLTDSDNLLLAFTSGPINNYIFYLESFNLSLNSEQSIDVTLKFVSNYEFNFSPMLTYPIEAFHGIGRVARWYDVIVQLGADSVPLTSYYPEFANVDVPSDNLNNFHTNGIDVKIVFENEKKVFGNTYNIPSFVFKNYTMNCNMSLNAPYNYVPNSVYAFVSPNNTNPNLQAVQDSVYDYNQYSLIPIGVLDDGSWYNEFFAWHRVITIYIGNALRYEAMQLNPYWFLTNKYGSSLNQSDKINIDLDLFIFAVSANAQGLVNFFKL